MRILTGKDKRLMDSRISHEMTNDAYIRAVHQGFNSLSGLFYHFCIGDRFDQWVGVFHQEVENSQSTNINV
jgi:hypothetical protein